MLVSLVYHFLEVIQEIFAHYIYYFPESCLDGIVNGIVDYRFTVRTEAVHLLQTAVSASHSGSKY